MSDALPSIFISYAPADIPFVDQLEGDLCSKRFSTWVDRRSLTGGQKWHRELQEAINRAQVLLVVLSPEAVASEYVQAEYSYALEEGKLVIPLYYRPSKVPMELRTIQRIDFQHSYDLGLEALVLTLQKQSNISTPTASSTETRPSELEQSLSQPPSDVLLPVASAARQVVPPLVGRQREWSQLQQLWQRAGTGGPQFVVLSGEAGIGKTRLAEELFGWVAQQGLSTARAACYAVEKELAYAPIGLWLRAPAIRTHLSSLPMLWLSEIARFVPELLVEQRGLPPPGPLSESWLQQRLLEALARALLLARPPLLLLLDDLHWCDRETLNWLHYLLRFDARARLLLVGTVRAEEVTKDHPLQAMLTPLRRKEQVTQINVEGLSATETASLAAQISGRELDAELARQLYRDTEGNALFVVETLRMGLEEAIDAGQENSAPRFPAGVEEVKLPPTIQAVIGARLEQLSAEIRELVNVAAVIGRAFSVELLAQASKRDEEVVLDVLDELWQRRIVREAEPEGYDFSHANIREVAYANLRPPRRRMLHRRVAQALEAVSADQLDSVSGQLAMHYEQAGEWAKTVQYAQRAGEQAQRLYDPRVAIEQYSRAVEAAQKGSLPTPPALYHLRGQAYETLGDFEQSRCDYEQALETARLAHDGAAEWQSLLDLGFLWAIRDYEQAGAWFRRAVALAERLDDPIMRAHSLNRLANWLLNTGHPTEGLRAHTEALVLFESQQDLVGMAETQDLLGIAHGFAGDFVNSVHHYGQAIDLLRVLGDRKTLIISLASRAVFASPVASDEGFSVNWSLPDCERDIAEALRLAREIKWAGEAFVEISSSYVLASFGQLSAGLAKEQQGLRLATRIEHQQWITGAHAHAAYISLLMLAPEEALLHAEPGLALAQQLGSAWWIAWLASHQALAYLLLGKLPQAEATLQAVLPPTQLPRLWPERRLLRVWAELALAQQQPDVALQRCDQLFQTAPQVPGVTDGQPIPSLLKCKGEALTALGRLEESVQVLEEARRGATMQQALPVLWQIERARGQVYQSLQQEEQAQRAFTAARALITQLAQNIDEPPLREQFMRRALGSLP